MFNAPKATTPPQNLLRITPGIEAPFHSAPRRHKPCLLIVPSKLRPHRDRTGTIRRVGTIGIVAIAAPVAPGLKASSLPLGSIRPRPRLEMIVATTSQRVGKIGKWAGPPITTITKRAILPTNALSPACQKTSIGLGNLVVGDWC